MKVKVASENVKAYLIEKPLEDVVMSYLPIVSFLDTKKFEGGKERFVYENISTVFPLYQFGLQTQNVELIQEDVDTLEKVIEAENKDEDFRQQQIQDEEKQDTHSLSQEELNHILEENSKKKEADLKFVKHEQQFSYDWEALKNYEVLKKTFYIFAETTTIGSDFLNLDNLQKDLSINMDVSGPQILIYHTHSQEAFADSVEGDESMTIQGVGEHLAQILREEYGYNVMHHTGQYDVATRDNAYSLALPDIETILADNPSIQVVIDLHRDAKNPNRQMVVDVDGRPTARFMMFNGISRTKKNGEIKYLANPNLLDNLAFSFQMQTKAGEYYPGLTRKIYVKEYRYNMHVKPRTLLIELGDNSNTVQEAMNACDPLAHILDMVIRP